MLKDVRYDTWKHLFSHITLCFFYSELKRQKAKAEKNDNIREVAEICNYLGEKYAQIGKFVSLRPPYKNEHFRGQKQSNALDYSDFKCKNCTLSY